MEDAENKMYHFPDVIELNVGGHIYTTSLTTLAKGKSDMLAVMFSGKYSVAKDKDGRYFIDADGELFAHILRYMRTGALPCASLCLEIHREAKYFGLEELQYQIEQMPSMMGRQARLQFQAKLTGFDEALEKVLKAASEKQCVVSDEIVSYAMIAIIKDPQHVNIPHFSDEHVCRVPSSIDIGSKNIKADLKIGPWEKIPEEVTERVYLRALVRELEWRGFTVTFSKQGQCTFEAGNNTYLDLSLGINRESLKCFRTLYKFIFHWHKCF